MNRNFSGRDNDFRSDSGQTLVLVALSMVVLMGFLGLAIDVGNLRAAQHKLQQAADSAALAGALEMSYCGGTTPCTQMTTDATKAVLENGLSTPTMSSNTCSGNGTGLSLYVNWGPCLLGTNDPNNGSKSYVEALVSQNVDMYFARALGLNSVRMSARAEAGKGNSSFCMYIGAAHPGTGTLQVDSGGQLTLSCGIQVDGSLDAKGNGSHVTATEFQVTASSGNGSNQFSPSPVFNAPTVPDPVCQSYPLESTYSHTTNCLTPITYTSPAPGQGGGAVPNGSTLCPALVGQNLTAGSCYGPPATGAITVATNKGGNGAPSAVTLTGNLTLSPGTYIFNGNLDLGGYNLTNTTTGGDGSGGVTLYFLNGSIINGGGSRINLNAPTSGSREGMLIWEDPADTYTMSLASGSQSSWDGMVVAPNATLDLSDGANATTCSQHYFIVDALNVINTHGSKTFNICSDFSTLADGDPIQGYTAVLVQ